AAIRKHGLKFLVIDDLRSYALSMIKFLKDPCVTAKITYHLKQLCEKFKIPILCTLKLGASADQHKDNMPRLTDINPEYGCVENADVIIFLSRPSFYFKPEDFDDDGEFDEDFYKSACVQVERHRNGPTGSVTLRYEQNIGRYFNMMEWDVEYN
ncbi:MAG: DnaB-like helicase C-terminal domain-containing protein, partial [bacterium]